MRRVKSACIFKTLVFSQKPDCGLSRDEQLKCNRDEVESYKTKMTLKHIRYRITEEVEQPDGSIVLKLRRQYNETVGPGEYLDM